MSQNNGWEQANRARKVAALVAALQAGKITAELAERMDYADWVATAAACNVKPPSDESKALVLADLRRAEMMARPSLIAPRGFASIGPGMVVRTGRKR